MSSVIYKEIMLRGAGLSLCLVVIVLCITVLIGWELDIEALKSVIPGHVSMKSNTAVTMLLCAMAVALLFNDKAGKISRLCIIFLSLAALVLAILTLSEDFFGWDLGIDQLLFKDKLAVGDTSIPGRMGAASAYCYILLGLAALVGSQRVSMRLRLPILATFSITTLVISTLTFFSHLSVVIFGIAFWNNAGMAVHTAAGCALLGFAILILIINEYKPAWSLDRLTTSVFIIGIIMLLVAAAESYRFTISLQENIKLVAYTQNILVEISEMAADVSDLQDGQRGYIITGDEKFLENREKIKTILPRDLQDTYALIQGNSSELKSFDKLKGLIAQKMDWEDQTIIATKQHGLLYGQHMIASGTGVKLAKEIEAVISRMEKNHYALLHKYQNQANAISVRTFLVLPIQVFLSMTILAFGLFLLNSGVDERKKVESQLRQSQKMEAIGQLTGGVAHDFNNFLGVIIGNLDLLERSIVDNEAALKRVQTIQRAATRGADLTKRLLTFSRLQNLNPAPTSLANSIQNMLEMASRAFGPEINITTNIDQTIPPVFVDAAGLESALLNLAVNARDAMPNGGTITITTQSLALDDKYVLAHDKELKPGHYAQVSISDTGHGMSSETLAKVFEPFFTTKPRGKGTGLGLSMVYGFVKQSNGLINIYSELGHGTTVSLYLPLSEGAIIPLQSISKNNVQTKMSGTVLVVDDEVDLLEVAVVFLEDMGYKVLHAVDGPSAINILEHAEQNIDLLVTDVIMPGGINGVELSAKARKLIPNIKIIYSSGYPSDALAEKSGLKINGPLINKPYQRKDFVATIRNVMEGQ